MNNNLRNLQSSIQIALDDPQVTPGQIVEIVRETLRMEASKARDAADKAEEALFAFGPTMGSFESPVSSIQGAQPVSSFGSDVISF